MPHLIVQHPTLSDAAVAAFSAAVSCPPHTRLATLARWHDVTFNRMQMDELAHDWQVDANLSQPELTLDDFGLAAFDMDSTLITVECIDEIADFMGRKADVAAITEAAMRGDITDFNESLRRRVALLAGLPERTLEAVWRERVALSPGVPTLISRLQAAGLKTLVVSGGFTFFTARLQAQLGLDLARGNVLEVHNGLLTGRVTGPVIDAQGKRRIVEQTCTLYGLRVEQAIVVGDGANDLAMLAIAGLSVAYRAKPRVRAATSHSIQYSGLDAILDFFSD